MSAMLSLKAAFLVVSPSLKNSAILFFPACTWERDAVRVRDELWA